MSKFSPERMSREDVQRVSRGCPEEGVPRRVSRGGCPEGVWTTNKKVLFLKKPCVLLFETLKNLIFWIVTRASTHDFTVFWETIMICHNLREKPKIMHRTVSTLWRWYFASWLRWDTKGRRGGRRIVYLFEPADKVR